MTTQVLTAMGTPRRVTQSIALGGPGATGPRANPVLLGSQCESDPFKLRLKAEVNSTLKQQVSINDQEIFGRFYDMVKCFIENLQEGWAGDKEIFTGSFNDMKGYLLGKLMTLPRSLIVDSTESDANKWGLINYMKNEGILDRCKEILGENITPLKQLAEQLRSKGERVANSSMTDSGILGEDLRKLNFPDTQKEIRYVDFGTGPGFNPSEFARIYCGSRPIYTVGIDIEDSWDLKGFRPQPHETNNATFDGVQIYRPEYNEDITAALNRTKHFADGNKVDLISFRHVLHHIPTDKLEPTLQSLHQVMSPDSYLWINEHDCQSTEDKSFLVVLHMIFDKLMNGEMSTGWFRGVYEDADRGEDSTWIKIMERNGFERMSVDVIKDSLYLEWQGIFRKKKEESSGSSEAQGCVFRVAADNNVHHFDLGRSILGLFEYLKRESKDLMNVNLIE